MSGVSSVRSDTIPTMNGTHPYIDRIARSSLLNATATGNMSRVDYERLCWKICLLTRRIGMSPRKREAHADRAGLCNGRAVKIPPEAS